MDFLTSLYIITLLAGTLQCAVAYFNLKLSHSALVLIVHHIVVQTARVQQRWRIFFPELQKNHLQNRFFHFLIIPGNFTCRCKTSFSPRRTHILSWCSHLLCAHVCVCACVRVCVRACVATMSVCLLPEPQYWSLMRLSRNCQNWNYA